jgi:hemerythrin
MDLLHWNDDLSVNIKEIDDQHKKLIDLLNTLHNAMSKGKSKEIMHEILTELVSYTKYHFETEENLMVKYNYFDRHSHRLEHEQFIQKVQRAVQDYKKGSILLSIEIITFLNDWVKNHILGTDKKYSNYLNTQGVY